MSGVVTWLSSPRAVCPQPIQSHTFFPHALRPVFPTVVAFSKNERELFATTDVKLIKRFLRRAEDGSDLQHQIPVVCRTGAKWGWKGAPDRA